MEASNQSGGKESHLCSGRFIKSCTTKAFRIRLVQLLVISHLDYWSVVYQDSSLGLKARLQWLSNAVIRYICGIEGMTQISPFKSKLGWLQTVSRMHYFALLTMYKVVGMKQPPLLAKLFKSWTGQCEMFASTLLKSLEPKKGAFPPSVWWVHVYGTSFPQKFMIFPLTRPLGGRLEGISWSWRARYPRIVYTWLKRSVIDHFIFEFYRTCRNVRFIDCKM